MMHYIFIVPVVVVGFLVGKSFFKKSKKRKIKFPPEAQNYNKYTDPASCSDPFRMISW